MKSNGTLSGLLMVIGVAIAFGAGYLLSKGFGAKGDGGDNFQRNSDMRADIFYGGASDGGITAVKQWKEVKERIYSRFAASPAPMVDFELLDENLGLLEKASVADLEAWMRELIPERHQDDDKNIPLLLRETIIMVLAQRCGGNFIRSLAENPLEDGDIYLDEVMFHWMRHDPSAALEWLDGHDLPEEIAEDIQSYREDALVELAGKDVDEFEKRLAAVDSDTRESVLEDYAYRRGTPENRAEILGRASRSLHGEAMALWEGLVRREVESDSERGFSTLKELGISDADRTDLDERVVISQMNEFSFNGLSIDRAKVMQDWTERNSGQEVSQRILSEFESWSQRDAENAVAWLGKQPLGLRYDEFAKFLIRERADQDEENFAQFASLAERITDLNARTEANIRIKQSWQAKDADAASEWERNLPPADRERLNR